MRKPDEARETREMRDRPSATTAIRNIRSTPTGLPLSHPNHPLAARQIPPNTLSRSHRSQSPARQNGSRARHSPRGIPQSPTRAQLLASSLSRPSNPSPAVSSPSSADHAVRSSLELHLPSGRCTARWRGHRSVRQCAIRACPTPPSNYAPPPPPGLDALSSSISVLGPHAL